MIRKFVLLLCWFVIGFTTTGFTQLRNRRADVDTDYIDDFPEIASVRFNISRRYFDFALRSKIGAKEKVSYAPNVQGTYGFSLYYRKLGLDLSLGLPASNRENTLFGKTRFFDFQVNSYGKKIGYDISFQSYKGFYQANPGDFDKSLKSWSAMKGYPQRPDLRCFNFGLNGYYVFNYKKFSYQAAFDQTERQLRSAGTFLVMGSSFFTRIRSDSTLFPSASTPAEGLAFKEGYFYTLAVAPGFAYSLIIKENFYLSPSICWGLGIRQQSYDIDAQRYKGMAIGQKINFRLAAGYYGQQVFAGINMVLDNNRIGMENVLLTTSAVNIRLFVGYRFNRLFGKDVQNHKLDRLLTNN
ncbi:MAG: DUF4421 family protein [Bacteroidota bacterium]